MNDFGKKTSNLVQLVHAIAKLGRTDAYAAYQYRGSIKYRKIIATVDESVVLAHLNNRTPIACYFVVGDETRCAVLDFDDHDKNLDWSEMINAAEPIVCALQERGMHVLMCRSGGGAGLHAWVFWATAQKAREVRAYLKEVVAHQGFSDGAGGVQSKQVEIFPKNDRVKEGGYGNAVALPFGRASVPLDTEFHLRALEDFEPPMLSEFFSPPVPEGKANVPTRKRASESASNSSHQMDRSISLIEDALLSIPADDYDIWIKVGLTLKTVHGEAGYSVWLSWSRSSPKFEGDDECQDRWETLEPDGSLSLGTIFHMAKENGWNRPVDPVIEDMNVKFAIFTHGQKTTIIVKKPEDDGNSVVSLLGKRPFEDRLAAQKHFIVNSDGSQSPMPLSKYWLGHKDADHIYRLDFDPAKPPGKNGTAWNVWSGIAVKPAPGNWDLLEAHIRDNIAGGDPEIAEWLLNWFALGVQQPSLVIGTAPVFLGLPGVGKGVLAHAYGSLWGRHFTTITHSAHVKGRFNNHLFGKRCVFIDEGIFSGDRTDSGVIKTRLTEPFVVLEQKGIDPIQVRNHMIFMVASNEDAAVPADLADRRWQVLEVADTQRDNKTYFKDIAVQFEGGGREALLLDLLQRDISKGPDPRKTIKTAGLFEQTVRAGGPVLRYVFEVLDEGVLPQPNAPGNAPGVSTIGALYGDMCARDRRGTYIPVTTFGKNLNRMVPSVKTVPSGTYLVHDIGGSKKTRSTRYSFPDLSTARQEFELYAGQPVPWSNHLDEWQDPPEQDGRWEQETPF